MCALRTTQYRVTEKDSLYPYLDGASLSANNLYNTTLFRIRQCMTGLKKDVPTENEQSVIQEIAAALPDMNAIRLEANDRKAEKYSLAVEANLKLPQSERQEIKPPAYSKPFVMPTAKKWLLSYTFLEALMKTTKNPDYVSMPSKQLAQSTMKDVCHDVGSILKSLKKYSQDPSQYTAKPKLTGYKKKGGRTTITFTNEDCRIKDGYLCFPHTDAKLKTGNRPGKLKQVTVKPWHNLFVVTTVMEVPDAEPPVQVSRRIMNFDLGVDNLAAITNNVGEPCLLFKGGVAKSINQKFNKDAARIMSEQTKGTDKKFVATPEYHALCLSREGKIRDLFHKYAKLAVSYALLWNIDTFVVGKNKYWKQSCNIGHKSNQEFVQLPFASFIQYLRSLCEENSILLIEQEESYTSKASFLDQDYIPTYGVDDQNASFSGKRRPTQYKGMYKKDGFRGLYVAGDGSIINADLNGSANIGRKCFPDMYTWDGTCMPDFNRVIIVQHPELWDRARNQEKQRRLKTGEISKSRLSRSTVRVGRACRYIGNIDFQMYKVA